MNRSSKILKMLESTDRIYKRNLSVLKLNTLQSELATTMIDQWGSINTYFAKLILKASEDKLKLNIKRLKSGDYSHSDDAGHIANSLER